MKEPKQLDLYISFVKECFRQETSDGERWKGMDWEEFFLFTQKQAVAGYVFEHVKRYKRDAIGIPEETLLNWFAYHDEIANRNKKVNQCMCEIVKDLSNRGLRSCILKGQGNAMLYPTPLSRMPGDIDIWVDADRKEIVDFVKAIDDSAKEREKHISFSVAEDIEVEVHDIPSTLRSPKYNRRLQEFFREYSDEQFSNVVRSDDFAIPVCVPTAEFNVVYQLAHIMSHFFVEGIGLRQFIDYAYVLRSAGVKDDSWKHSVAERLEYLGMLKFARGVMWVLRECIELDEELLYIETDERIGRLIRTEIINGGNFGYHDARYPFRKSGYIARGLTDIYRLLKLVPYFPNDALWKILRKFENQKWKLKGN